MSANLDSWSVNAGTISLNVDCCSRTTVWDVFSLSTVWELLFVPSVCCCLQPSPWVKLKIKAELKKKNFLFFFFQQQSYFFQFWAANLTVEILVFPLGVVGHSNVNFLEGVCVAQVTHSELHWLNAAVSEVLTRPCRTVLALQQYRTVAYLCQNHCFIRGLRLHCRVMKVCVILYASTALKRVAWFWTKRGCISYKKKINKYIFK